jgi:putative endonuclease
MPRKIDHRYNKGIWSEYLAAFFLVMKGYRILAMRYQSPMGEIDIIAKRSKVIAAIEVKNRPTRTAALEAVSRTQQGRIEKAMQSYLARYPLYQDYNVRYDIMAITPLPFHLPNAWEPRS